MRYAVESADGGHTRVPDTLGHSNTVLPLEGGGKDGTSLAAGHSGGFSMGGSDKDGTSLVAGHVGGLSLDGGHQLSDVQPIRGGSVRPDQQEADATSPSFQGSPAPRMAVDPTTMASGREKYLGDLGETPSRGAWTRVNPAALNAAMRRQSAEHSQDLSTLMAQLHSAGAYAESAQAVAAAVMPAPSGASPLILDDAKRGGWFDSRELQRLQEQMDELIEGDIGGGKNNDDDASVAMDVRRVQAFNAHFMVGAALLRGGFELAATFRFRLASAAVPSDNASLLHLATAQEAELRGCANEADAEFRVAEASARQELARYSSTSAPEIPAGGATKGLHWTPDASSALTSQAPSGQHAVAAAIAATALSRALAGQARSAERRGCPMRAAELLGAAALASPVDTRTLAALARALALIGDVAGAEGVLRFCCAPYRKP